MCLSHPTLKMFEYLSFEKFQFISFHIDILMYRYITCKIGNNIKDLILGTFYILVGRDFFSFFFCLINLLFLNQSTKLSYETVSDDRYFLYENDKFLILECSSEVFFKPRSKTKNLVG